MVLFFMGWLTRLLGGRKAEDIMPRGMPGPRVFSARQICDELETIARTDGVSKEKAFQRALAYYCFIRQLETKGYDVVGIRQYRDRLEIYNLDPRNVIK